MEAADRPTSGSAAGRFSFSNRRNRRSRGAVAVVAVLLLLLLLLLHAWGAEGYQLVWVARRPSRNTAGFDVSPELGTGAAPAVSYTMPLLEFEAAVESVASAPLTFEPVLPSVAYRLGPAQVSGCRHDGEERLARAARRSILTYGLFAELGSGLDVASVVAQAAASGAVEAGGASWRVGLVAMGVGGASDADATNKCVLEEELRPLLVSSTAGLGLDAGMEVPNERITPALDLFLFLLPNQQLLLCKRLAKGPAVGRGYTFAETPRRPRAGVLKLLAQYRLAQQAIQTPTAMEPELSLLMATMARVRRGSRVLDPFVGGGSILLAAGLLGAGEMVGTDAAADLLADGAPVRAAALDAFDTLMVDGRALLSMTDEPLPPAPTLLVADIRNHLKDENAAVFGRAYDAIITDPPYSIKEKVRGGGANEQRADVIAIIATLLQLAARVLVPGGGRLVFFLPVWGQHGLQEASGASKGVPVQSLSTRTLASSELWTRWNTRLLQEQSSLLGNLPSLGLRLVGAQPQIFTPTFYRWLVCIEREQT